MKKTQILIVVLALLLTLSACGQPSPSPVSTAAPAPSSGVGQPSPSGSSADAPADDAAEQEAFVIGLSLADAASGWADFSDRCAQIARENGDELLLSDASGKADEQVKAVKSFLSSGCDLLIIQSVDAAALHETLQQARKDGVRVVALLTPLGEGDWDGWYCYDEYGIGRSIGEAAGAWLNENHDGQGHVGIFEHPTDPAMISRVQGIRDALLETAPQAHITATAQCVDPNDAGNETAAIFALDPEIAALCSYSDSLLLASLPTVTAARKAPSRFALFGADGLEDALLQIAAEGCYKTTVFLPSDAYAADVMNLALALLSGDDGGVVYAPFTPVTLENVKEFLPDSP